MDLPTTSIVIDRDRAGDLGIPMSEVGTSLATMLGGNNVNRFSLAGRSYEVVPQVARDFRRNEDRLNNYYVRASSGETLAALIAGADDPEFSVWFGGPSDTYIAGTEAGILEPYISPNADQIPDDKKDPDGYWTGIYIGGSAVSRSIECASSTTKIW